MTQLIYSHFYGLLPLITLCLLLFLGWQILQLLLAATQYIRGRPVRLEAIFSGLRPKLWMTFGLGLFFFPLYAFVIILVGYLLDREKKQALFNFAYQHPIYCVYLGLCLFVLVSLSILGLRSLIKRLYLRRKK